MNEMETYEEGDLKIQIDRSDFLLRMIWLGKCTLKEPSKFLDPIINELYVESQKSAKKLLFDFTNFTFMNSSAIIPIIKTLKTIREGRGVVHVHYNKEEKWQRTLIGELRVFQTDDSRIQIKGV